MELFEPVGASLLAMAILLQLFCKLDDRYREQARSHIQNGDDESAQLFGH
ncbi:hypothetical protein [Pseudomonas corrugata]|nr:hypothetical protein [Pseudomonas corrugata]MDU9022479.1 hypothetical protein [Pseudomonas corrugata]